MNAPLKKPTANNRRPEQQPADWQALDAKAKGGGAPDDDMPLPDPGQEDDMGGRADIGNEDDSGMDDDMGGGDDIGAGTSASSNFPPVGDIKLSKSKGTFNTYKLELSYGQIECLRQALEKDHANPIADERKTMFDYYISTVPGPGEEEEDLKARDESDAIGQDLGGEDDDMGLPMPPNQEPEEGTTVAGEGPEDMGGNNPEPSQGGRGGGPGPAGRNGSPRGGGGGEEETEKRLPAPPRE